MGLIFTNKEITIESNEQRRMDELLNVWRSLQAYCINSERRENLKSEAAASAAKPVPKNILRNWSCY